METTIFYFSATGNSLSLARNLSNNLENSEIVPISTTVKNETIQITVPRIGIVFPVFAWGMPRIVEEFFNKLSFEGSTYIFAIVTCVAIQGNTLKDLKKILKQKGVDLDAGFAVKSKSSSLMRLNKLDNIIIRLDKRRLRIKSAEERLPEIVSVIKNFKKHRPETSSWTANIFGSMFHGFALKSFKTIDSAFVVEDSCKECGTCAKICPRSNIVIENGRPVFQHNCEFCHACIQWCPSFAIKHPDFNKSLKQYHNSAIRLTDMISSRTNR